MQSKSCSNSKFPIISSNPLQTNNNSTKMCSRFPKWLHHSLPSGIELNKTNQILQKHRLNTVCEEAKCPNRMECYSKKTATFLVLGSACTRACGFCDIDFTKIPQTPDATEPKRIALCAKELGLKHVVITMVARDDLPDGGVSHLIAIIQEMHLLLPHSTLEFLTSDLMGNFSALDLLLQQKIAIFNHNLETVERLTPRIRHKATYSRSLSLLQHASSNPSRKYFIKSGIMLGFGEEEEEVKTTLNDLYHSGSDIVTIGQYLQSNKNRLRVKSFVPPETFKKYEEYGLSIGIRFMYCGPFVRSSYNAHEFHEFITKRQGVP